MTKSLCVYYNPTDRERNDLYCTNPIAVQMLLDREKFDKNVWECCNGLGHISNVLKDNGYNVRKSDIINYNNEDDVEIIDMLTYDKPFDGDIITNPPYKLSTEITQKCLELSGGKVAMYNSLNFLSSQKRKPLFEQYPPKTVYIMSKRISCAKNGDFEHNVNGAIDYCWVVWDKNYNGSTELKWI
jgi:hypothetical protein